MALLVATSVHADTIQYSHDYGFLAVDVDLDAERDFVAFPADTWDAQIDQFDSSLGSLVGIAFDFNLNFEIGGMTNDDPGDSILGTGGGMGAFGYFFYNSTDGWLQNEAGNGASAGSTEANTAFSETFLVTATWALEDSMDASAWSDLAQAVTGSGSWTFMWNAVMGGSFGTGQGPGNPNDVSGLDLDSLYAQLNSGSITVTYDYEANSNPVPGPAAVMAVAAIGLVRRRSRG
ncbi:MAG: hypothetical protein CMJ23_04280 [Phycisphaerae bacterium]|nr:hypothetical protein [Phycisphaerae bacterium]